MSKLTLHSWLNAIPANLSQSPSPVPAFSADSRSIALTPQLSTFAVPNLDVTAKNFAETTIAIATEQPMKLLPSTEQMILPSPQPAIRFPEQTFGNWRQNTVETQTTGKPLLVGALPVIVDPLIRLNGPRMTSRRLKVLQRWEGIVSEVGDDVFKAYLLDLMDSSKPREIVELPLEEIPDADLPLLMPGCVFYWTMGYLTTDGGQKIRTSEMRIRRNPRWSQHEIESIKKRAEELFQQYAGATDDPT